jgi:hypothetical protein
MSVECTSTIKETKVLGENEKQGVSKTTVGGVLKKAGLLNA